MRVLAARYELQSLIGRGGMGEVWRGVDRELGRTVAIKVLPAELTRHDEFRTRFRREARTVASLSHQGVATLYDVGEDTGDGADTTPFLVMEFVDGRTLADVLRDGPVPAERALAIARDVADALVHSHGHGLIHRDIKPSNVMLTAAGGVKVLDFGIAKALAETTTRLTATGMTVGTPAYLSPEQIDGGAVDGRSDLYSLGCLLYELLAGHPPFAGDSPFVVMNQHLMKTPGPPSALRPQIPADVDALVLRLLAKEPAQRPASAAELRDTAGALITRLRDASAPGGTRAAAPPAPPAQAPYVPPQSAPESAAPGTPAYVAAQPTAVARGGTGVPTAPGPGSAADIPAPPPSSEAAAHAATHIVPPSLQVRTGPEGPWAVKFRVTRDGLTALAGVAMVPLTFLTAQPEGFKGLNYLAVAAVPLALVALLWSARIAALIAWMPPAVLLSAMYSYADDVDRDSGFPYSAFRSQIGWDFGSFGSNGTLGFVPVAAITLIALVSFLADRNAPAWYVAVFWNFGMLLPAGSSSVSLGAVVVTGWVALGVLLAITLVQEFTRRTRIPQTA